MTSLESKAVRRDGKCPYCGNASFTDVATPNPSYVKGQCTSCLKWSARMMRNSARYPLQNGSDPESSPVTVGRG